MNFSIEVDPLQQGIESLTSPCHKLAETLHPFRIVYLFLDHLDDFIDKYRLRIQLTDESGLRFKR